MACRRSRKRIVSIWITVTFIQKIAASLHRAMPEYCVGLCSKAEHNLSNTARVSVSEKSSLLDMPEKDQWQFFHSGSNTNLIPPQLRKFAHRFLVGFILFSVLCFGQIYGGKGAVLNRLLLMMLFFFGVAALRAFFLEQYSDWFARRVVHRMRFTASIPTPKFESSLGSRFGFVMLVILFIFLPRCSDVRRVFLGRATPHSAGGRHGWFVGCAGPTAHRR